MPQGYGSQTVFAPNAPAQRFEQTRTPLRPVQPGGSMPVFAPNAPAQRFEQNIMPGNVYAPNAPAQRFEQTRTPLGQSRRPGMNRNQRTANVLGGGTL